MHTVYLLTGSNQGDRAMQLKRVTSALQEKAGNVTASSRVYETEAWGVEGLPAHLNQALVLETELAPLPLLEVLHQIEEELGRIRQERWGVRAVDIDIIYFDHQIIDLPQLKVPHPLLQERNFVLAPLAEIAPGYRHPILGKTNIVLLEESQDTLKVVPLAEEEPGI